MKDPNTIDAEQIQYYNELIEIAKNDGHKKLVKYYQEKIRKLEKHECTGQHEFGLKQTDSGSVLCVRCNHELKVGDMALVEDGLPVCIVDQLFPGPNISDAYGTIKKVLADGKLEIEFQTLFEGFIKYTRIVSIDRIKGFNAPPTA